MIEDVVRQIAENQLQWMTTSITVLAAVVLIILERWMPYTKGQKLFRPGFLNDFVLYTLVQSYVLGLVIFGILDYVDNHTDIERILSVRLWPVWLQVVLFLVTHDFYIYWFHRFQHRNKWFWRTHEAHHSTSDVDWLSGSRSHSLEILINQTIEFAPIILLASPEVAIVKGCIDAVWGMYIHSNVDIRSGKLQYIINGPEMHRWHHAVDDQAHNKNFSTKLAIWDWMFGTAYLPQQQKPSGFGLGPDFPTSYLKQHTYAFRPFDD